MAHLPRLNPAALASVLLTAAGLAPGLRAQVTETTQTIDPGSVLMRMDAI